MKVPKKLRPIHDLYAKNIREMGVTPKAVGWKTDECQQMRFEKLAAVISEEKSAGVTVNDYGCGYGAMLKYLRKKRHIQVTRYNGYDISKEMLAAAQKELSAFTGRLNLVASENITTVADYSFVSGTFNVRFDVTTAAWEKYLRGKLFELDRYSKKGFAFNLLTSYVDYEEYHLYYGDPCYWFEYCKKNFSKRVSLLHDYPLWEWTMIVKKEA